MGVWGLWPAAEPGQTGEEIREGKVDIKEK